ncbi:hypothetical protein BJ508DRAFT_307576 [Ascobolus immersus RN42]|uniref:Uncharacterized protein n=1 Tax=Ascobolus immersus RN42 TaxID=1160509 RepID=A0A3N4I2P3_ASCIM|nr:hypothetical protein BJ508DRAFT_307576 [Ascobolus immersus RN42]
MDWDCPQRDSLLKNCLYRDGQHYDSQCRSPAAYQALCEREARQAAYQQSFHQPTNFNMRPGQPPPPPQKQISETAAPTAPTGVAIVQQEPIPLPETAAALGLSSDSCKLSFDSETALFTQLYRANHRRQLTSETWELPEPLTPPHQPMNRFVVNASPPLYVTSSLLRSFSPISASSSSVSTTVSNPL